MSEILEQAKKWIDSGISVIPIWPGQKKPRIEWREYEYRLTTECEIESWFKAWPRSNLGVVTGWNNLVVLDFDNLDDFFTMWDPDKHKTMTVITSRGAHLYLYTEQFPTMWKIEGIPIDIQGSRRYVVAPPSIHPSGERYQYLNDYPIMKVDKLSDFMPELSVYYQEPSRQAAAVQAPEPRKVGPVMLPDPWEVMENADQSRPNLAETINQRVRIIDFFPEAEGSGRFRLALCPFHDDHHPSFWIDTERNVCNCHTCGGKVMDVINYWAKTYGLDNRTAIDQLRQIYLNV